MERTMDGRLRSTSIDTHYFFTHKCVSFPSVGFVVVVAVISVRARRVCSKSAEYSLCAKRRLPLWIIFQKVFGLAWYGTRVPPTIQLPSLSHIPLP